VSFHEFIRLLLLLLFEKIIKKGAERASTVVRAKESELPFMALHISAALSDNYAMVFGIGSMLSRKSCRCPSLTVFSLRFRLG
jgi:hypothetical protein